MHSTATSRWSGTDRSGAALDRVAERDTAEVAVFGGTGLYDAGLLEDAREIRVPTPYGATSDTITLGNIAGRQVAFIPRHGRGHTIPPHLINYRANVWAFRELGVRRIISPSAVGSLKEEVAPGDFVLPEQFLDFTKSRITSFSEKGRVIHISAADPFCPQLREVVLESARRRGIKVHTGATYVCVEGPRFSTRAESLFFRSTGADVIGMTLSPECQLAREAQICYESVSMVTDYDVWAQKPVTAREVMRVLSENVEKVRSLLSDLMSRIPGERSCQCGRALSEAEF